MRLPWPADSLHYRCGESTAQTAARLAAIHDNKTPLGNLDGRTPWECLLGNRSSTGSSSSLRIVFRVRLGGAGNVVSVGSRQPPCCNLEELCCACTVDQTNFLSFFFGLAQPKSPSVGTVPGRLPIIEPLSHMAVRSRQTIIVPANAPYCVDTYTCACIGVGGILTPGSDDGRCLHRPIHSRLVT